MPGQSVFLNVLYVYMASFLLMQFYFYIRIRRNRKQGTSGGGAEHLTSKGTLLFGLFHTSFFIFAVIWVFSYIRNGFFSVPFGIVLIVIAFMVARKPISLVLKNRPRPIGFSKTLDVRPQYKGSVTPEFIQEILSERSVIAAIKNDLARVRQIGDRERFRLGLITPGRDQIDPSTMRLPLTRAAILHSSTFLNMQFNNLLVLHGAKRPMIERYPGWSYRLSSTLARDECANIRDLRIDVNSASSQGRNPCLPAFLREDGFPLQHSYADGDPLTTERGGTVVLDKGALKIIYPNYLVQRSLIDDEGNLIHMGLDENFQYDSLWDGITLAPSVSGRLYKAVEYHGFVPVVRYRSFPYGSEFMLPILDTPLSDSGWADVYIDPHGRAKLFVARQKTLQEWYQLMERLRQLFFGELAKKGNHLLGLTKDGHHLYEYFCRKQAILNDYFITIDWTLP